MQKTILALALTTPLLTSQAKLELPALFSDHMVVQCDSAVPIWGWAAPGQKVTVRIAGQEKSTQTGENGTWKLTLDKLAAGGPHEMVVEAATTARIRDVLVGEVWLGSGQSNMAWRVRQSRDFEQRKERCSTAADSHVHGQTKFDTHAPAALRGRVEGLQPAVRRRVLGDGVLLRQKAARGSEDSGRPDQTPPGVARRSKLGRVRMRRAASKRSPRCSSHGTDRRRTGIH